MMNQASNSQGKERVTTSDRKRFFGDGHSSLGAAGGTGGLRHHGQAPEMLPGSRGPRRPGPGPVEAARRSGVAPG